MIPFDVGAGTAAIGLLTTSRWSHALALSPNEHAETAIAVSGYVLLLVLGIRILWGIRIFVAQRRQPVAPNVDMQPLDQILGDIGMDPLSDLDEDDPLDRRPFVDALEKVIRYPRMHSVTFGLNGPWGSGKTTILNALAKRLDAHGAKVIRFDAWSFREPSRIIDNYLTQLGDTLEEIGAPTNLRFTLRKLGRGLAPLAGGRIRDAIHAWLSTTDADSTDALLQHLRESLQRQKQVIVVVADDLDRLDRDELHATLRMFRLLANLPHIVHLLAYDRQQIARILFPDDETEQIARDYLGKIVNFELPVSTPTPEAADRILSMALRPLFDAVGKEEKDRFIKRLEAVPLQIFIEAMPTPREIRRVAASTAFVWPQIARDVNLFDLFVLQVLHLRFPRVFRALHAHPEWFTVQDWSSDLWRRSEGDRWRAEGNKYLEDLQLSTSENDVAATRILSLIFPHAYKTPGQPTPTEGDARRERLICHPQIFARYFQLSVPRERLSESSIEDLAHQVREASESMRIILVQKAISDAIRCNAVAAFFDQWDIFVQELRETDGPVNYPLLHDVAIGVARTADELPRGEGLRLSPRRTAASGLLSLTGEIKTNEKSSQLLADIVRECTNFAVSGPLVFFTVIIESRRRQLRDRVLDEVAIRDAFDASVRTRILHSKEKSLFDLDDEEISEILYRTKDSHLTREVFIGALGRRPHELPRILRFALTVEIDDKSPASVVVDGTELLFLHKRIDLHQMNVATKHLPENYWENAIDRAMVQYFRENYQAVISQT